MLTGEMCFCVFPFKKIMVRFLIIPQVGCFSCGIFNEIGARVTLETRLKFYAFHFTRITSVHKPKNIVK